MALSDEVRALQERVLADLISAHDYYTDTYVSKAGRLARFRDGEKIDISENYHRETWELIHKVVFDVSNAAIAKA